MTVRLTAGLAALLSLMLVGCEGSETGLFGLGGTEAGAAASIGRAAAEAEDDDDDDDEDEEDDD